MEIEKRSIMKFLVVLVCLLSLGVVIWIFYNLVFEPSVNIREASSSQEKRNQEQSYSAPTIKVNWDSNQTTYTSNTNTQSNLQETREISFEAKSTSKKVLSLSTEELKQKTILFHEEMKRENPRGYEIYLQAEEEKSTDLFFEAGDSFDKSFSAMWGDLIFGGTTYREFNNNVGVKFTEEQVKEVIDGMQKSLVFGCECYMKCLDLEPDHYQANFRLASALTAALQIDVAIPYWRKAISLNRLKTLQGLIFDSTSWHHRGTAAKKVIEHLKVQPSDYPEWAEILIVLENAIKRFDTGYTSQATSANYLQQQKSASKLFESNAYLLSKLS